MLGTLESNISDYERETGRAPSADRLVPGTFSGYTTALVDAVAKLTNYLREVVLLLLFSGLVRTEPVLWFAQGRNSFTRLV